MLDLVKDEATRIDSRFLEPACGNGNFLTEVLRRKLSIVNARYDKSQIEWERYAVLAVSSIYGVDILEDNAQECRTRLFNIFDDNYTALFKDKCKDDCRRSVQFLLGRNILWGDALDFTNPNTNESIVFSEWSMVNSTMIKRQDYRFRSLVEDLNQTSMFNKESTIMTKDESLEDFPLIHFLKLGEDG